MKYNLRLFALFARSRQGARLAASILLILVLLMLVPDQLTGVPFRDGVANLLVVAVSLLPSASLAVHFHSPMLELERIGADWRFAALRAVWFFFIALALVCGAIGVQLFVTVDPAVMWVTCRNILLSMGVAWVAALTMPSAYSWVPGTLFVGAVWILGTNTATGDPAIWSVPNYPMDSALAWTISGITFVVAWLGYALLSPNSPEVRWLA